MAHRISNAPPPVDRVVILVLDSVGCGGSRDAERYDDGGSDTLGHIGDAVGGLALPNLQAMGLGNLVPIKGVAPAARPLGAFGRLQERSAGKDTTTGHWEIAGLLTEHPFSTYTEGFPQPLIDEFVAKTGRAVIGNKSASGTEILDELGEEHLRTGDWIVYTSVDSVFQLAAHEEKISLEELYSACKIARKLCDPLRVGRVIARPFLGDRVGKFQRTYNRHDYGMPPHGTTIMDRIKASGRPVVGVGKIGDIFCEVGLTESIRTAGNDDTVAKTVEVLRRVRSGMIFVNLIDFDTFYGHRRDPRGYGDCLEAFDGRLPEITEMITERDLLIITADHGNDPTYRGTDHTREQVPLIVYGPPTAASKSLGVREGFFDVAATIAEAFKLEPMEQGVSFYSELIR